MKLIESGQEVEFIDIDRDRVPCSLLIKLIDRTYRMTFRYNEVGDFFTVDLETVSGGSRRTLVFAVSTSKPFPEPHLPHQWLSCP